MSLELGIKKMCLLEYWNISLVISLGFWYPRCSNTEMSRVVYSGQWYCVPAADSLTVCTRIHWSSKASSSPSSGASSTQSLFSAKLSPGSESEMCQSAHFVINTSSIWQVGSSLCMPFTLHVDDACSIVKPAGTQIYLSHYFCDSQIVLYR